MSKRHTSPPPPTTGDFTGTVLFWLMILLGGALLIPGLMLPPWFEYQAARQLQTAKTERIAKLETELATLRKQNEFRDDPAYLERLERLRFGGGPFDAQAIYINPAILEETQESIAAQASAARTQHDSELDATVEAYLIRYPVLQAFLRDETRPILMACGAGLILLAVLLLSKPRLRMVATPAGGGDAQGE